MERIELNQYESWNEKKTLKRISVNELIEQIQTGGNNALYIERARNVERNCRTYKLIKSILPAVAWNVNFRDGKEKKDITGMTGCIYFDKDGLTEEQIQGYKQQLAALPYIIAVWVSLSGNGIGCLIKCDGIKQQEFSDAWVDINNTVGIGFDKGANKITQLNIISYDPDIRFNANAVSYQYQRKNIPDKTDETSNNSKRTYAFNKNINTDIYRQMSSTVDYNNDKIYFKTKYPDEIFEGKDFKVFPNKTDVLEVYTRNIIPEGKRYNTLIAICSSLILINPQAKKENLLKIFHWINKRKCFPPMEDAEINSLFNSLYKKYLDGKLYAKPKQKTILFNNPYLTPKDKLKINGEEMGRLRRMRREQGINEAITFIYNAGEIIAQKQVAFLCGINVRTVRRYWDSFKNKIDALNKITSNNNNGSTQ